MTAYYGSCGPAPAHPDRSVRLDELGHCAPCRTAGYPGRDYPYAGPFHVVAFASHSDAELGYAADVRTFATSADATAYANRDAYPWPIVSTVANDPDRWPVAVRQALGAECAECGVRCYWYTGHSSAPGVIGAPIVGAHWTHAGYADHAPASVIARHPISAKVSTEQ